MKQLLHSAVLVGLGLGSGMAMAVPGYVDDSGVDRGERVVHMHLERAAADRRGVDQGRAGR